MSAPSMRESPDGGDLGRLHCSTGSLVSLHGYVRIRHGKPVRVTDSKFSKQFTGGGACAVAAPQRRTAAAVGAPFGGLCWRLAPLPPIPCCPLMRQTPGAPRLGSTTPSPPSATAAYYCLAVKPLPPPPPAAPRATHVLHAGGRVDLDVLACTGQDWASGFPSLHTDLTSRLAR